LGAEGTSAAAAAAVEAEEAAGTSAGTDNSWGCCQTKQEDAVETYAVGEVLRRRRASSPGFLLCLFQQPQRLQLARSSSGKGAVVVMVVTAAVNYLASFAVACAASVYVCIDICVVYICMCVSIYIYELFAKTYRLFNPTLPNTAQQPNEIS
jgi:hypothetical protein